MPIEESALADDRGMARLGFESECVLPEQLLTRAHDARTQGEKRLMLAVLEDAVACLQRGAVVTTPRSRRESEAARAWITSDDTAWPFSFVNICHALGLDPECLRRGLGALAARGERRASGNVVPFRFAFRRIGGSRTKTVVPRRHRGA